VVNCCTTKVDPCHPSILPYNGGGRICLEVVVEVPYPGQGGGTVVKKGGLGVHETAAEYPHHTGHEPCIPAVTLAHYTLLLEY